MLEASFWKRKYEELKILANMLWFNITMIPYFVVLMYRYYYLNAVKHVKYATTRPRQQLDIYRGTSKQVILFLHGGTWISGDKSHYVYFAQFLQKQGFTVVIPNYTLYPKAHYDEMVEDVTLAIKWVQTNIATYGGDPNSLLLLGHSAGAHLLSLVCSQHEFSGLLGLVAMCGVYDLALHYQYEAKYLREVISPMWRAARGVEHFDKYSPYKLAKSNFPNCIIMHAGKDTMCPPMQSSRFADRLQHDLQVNCQYVELTQFSHSEPVTCFMNMADHLRDSMLQELNKAIAQLRVWQ